MAAPDYFALLGLPNTFDIDLAALETAYFAAQRQYHPDRFVGKPPAERQKALQTSVDINNAYYTLKEPHSRAVYMLKMQGIDIADSRNAQKPSQELLMEIMDWREQVGDATTPDALLALDTALSGLQSAAPQHISQSLRSSDWDGAAQQTMRLGYLQKTREEMAQKIKRLKLQAASNE